MADRDFKGVWIPKEVYLDTRLSALEKFIYVEIDSLSAEGKGCFASNKHLADFCQCSETKVSNAISKLIEIGLVEVASFDGRSRILQSCLTKNAGQPYKKCKAALQKVQHSNTDINTDNKPVINTPLYSPKGEERKRFTKPTVEEVEAYCKERNNNVDAQRFIDYYESVGWKRGKVKISDWKACVRTWERNDKPKKQEKSFDEIIADVKEGRVSDF